MNNGEYIEGDQAEFCITSGRAKFQQNTLACGHLVSLRYASLPQWSSLDRYCNAALSITDNSSPPCRNIRLPDRIMRNSFRQGWHSG
jgi:hypothetical protein